MAHNEAVDVVLVGAGIMSATLAVLLKELDPGLKLEVVELMDSGAAESSNPWNNAGTGHAGLCELNYTPQAADGSIDIKKAVHINTQFEVSKQFWAYLTKKGTFGSSKSFISPVPHLSFVQGEKGVSFLKKRFETLSQHHAFSDMHYTEDRSEMAEPDEHCRERHQQHPVHADQCAAGALCRSQSFRRSGSPAFRTRAGSTQARSAFSEAKSTRASSSA